MQLSDLNLPKKRIEEIRQLCKDVAAQSVTLIDMDWKEYCEYTRKLNQQRIDLLFKNIA